MVKRFFLIPTAFLLLTIPAHADPISIVLLGVNALLGTSLAASTAILSIGGTAVITIGSAIGGALALAGLAFSALLAGGQGKMVDPGKLKGTFQSESAGRLRCIGRARVGGVQIFGNTKQANRYRLIAHSAGAIDAVEDHFLGGRSVTVESNGAVSSPPFGKPDGTSYVYINSKIGDGTETAWAQLSDSFPDLWTAAHRARGIAQSLITYVSPGQTTKKFMILYQGGVPDYQRVQRGEKLYDPRTDTTVWSDNSVLAVMHVLLSYPDISLSDFDLDFIKVEADKADVLVPVRGGGQEKRSRAWGVWDEDGIERGDLVRQLMMSTGTELTARPGAKIGVQIIDDSPLYDVKIGFNQIYSIDIKSGPDGVERPNKLRLKYYSPERNYEVSEVELFYDTTAVAPVPLPWAYISDEIARVGEKEFEVALPFCPSASQAQRIGRRLFAEARADTIEINTTLAGLATWGTKTIAIDDDDLEVTHLIRHKNRAIDDEQGIVTISGVIVPDLEPWDSEADEALPPEQVPEIEYDTTIATPAAATAAIVVIYPDLSVHTRYVYPDVGGGMLVEASYRIISGGVPGAWLSMTEYRGTGGLYTSHAFVPLNLSGVSTEFRHRVFNADDDGSKWGDIVPFTPAISNMAPAVPAVDVETFETDAGTMSRVLMLAPASINVSFLRLKIKTVPGGILLATVEFNTKPDQNIEYIYAGEISAELTAHSSDGTSSAPVTS